MSDITETPPTLIMGGTGWVGTAVLDTRKALASGWRPRQTSFLTATDAFPKET